MDHSVRRSMKNAANCVKYGELQGSRNRYMSNAYGAFIFMMEARLSEGLLNGIDHLLSRASTGRLRGLGIHGAAVPCFPLDVILFLELAGLETRSVRASLLQALERVPTFPCISPSGFMATRRQAFPLKKHSIFGPQIRRGYPPNLSISFSGGKETKEDSLSNGERTGISPAPNLPSLRRQDLWCAGTPSLVLSLLPSPLERGPFP